jgi:hypothetical protein
MKGFLNKVQRRVSGGGTPAEAKTPDKPATPTLKPAATSNNRAGIEATPKADVSLPRRERR